MNEYIRALRLQLNKTIAGNCSVGGILDVDVGRGGVTRTIGELGGDMVLRLLVFFGAGTAVGAWESVTTGTLSIALASLATLCDFE
jgi:hypothetical protein